MPQANELAERLRQARGKIARRVILSALLPLALYGLLNHLGIDDFVALGSAAAIPASWTALHLAWRGRIEWIGVFAVLGFLFQLVFGMLLGGSTFLLKTKASVLTGPIGLVLLISAALDKPLLVPVLRLLGPAELQNSGVLEKLSSDRLLRRRITGATIILGGVLVLHAASAIVFALTLSTTTFLIVSKLFNWSLIGAALGVVWWLRRRDRRRADAE
jgi:hypothetical protein